MSTILVAEDEELLREAVVDALSNEGHKVTAASSGTDAIAFCEMGRFDLLVLDWNMPGHTGVEVSKRYRQSGKSEPILFLTSRHEIVDKESAFAGGADDYLTKPFDLRELLLRVRALLKRPVACLDETIRLGAAVFDPKAGTIQSGTQIARLQPREAELLLFFVKRPAQVINAEIVRTAVWGTEFEGSNVALRACLVKVRKALAVFDLAKSIETVHGFGYQFKPPEC